MFFCSNSLHLATKFMHLDTQLHERRNVYLSKEILFGLYEYMGVASRNLKEWENIEILLVSIPIWLLKLWLNATFEPSKKANIPINP